MLLLFQLLPCRKGEFRLLAAGRVATVVAMAAVRPLQALLYPFDGVVVFAGLE
jgi:hypothetical protein